MELARAPLRSLGVVGDVLELERSDCELPNVSWIVPNAKVSEHPQALVSTGQAYVTTLINSIMRSPCWGSTAMFLSWDDWGGFYDNVVPPDIDENGYGFRVPGLVISRPMAVRIPVRTYVKKRRGWGIWKATSISARPRARR